MHDGLEIDLVTHDARKFFGLLLKKNGYVLEQVLLAAGRPHDAGARGAEGDRHGCVTRHHAHHYLGFAETQWRLFEKESPPRVKPLLYVYRVLLTGIHLMRTGEVEANLPSLLNEPGAPGYLPGLIEAKIAGEHRRVDTLADAVPAEHLDRDLDDLLRQLDQAQSSTDLPEDCDAEDDLHDLLVDARLDAAAAR